MVDIILYNVPDRCLHPLVPVQSDGVPHGQLQQFRQFLSNDNAILRQGDSLRVLPMPQVDVLGELVQISDGHEVGVIGPAAAGRLQQGLVGGYGLLHIGAVQEVLLHLGQLAGGGVLVDADAGVVDGNLVKLLVQDGENGLVKAEAGDDQSRAAADADHGHPEPPLVAEQIAHGHLPGEGQPVPHKPHPLQQNPPPRLGGLGAHQICGRGHQGGQAGPQRRPGGARHRRQHRQHAQRGLLPELQRGHGVHDVERVGNHRRNQGTANGQP